MIKKARLFTPGPTALHPEVQAALARPIVHHRTDEFRALIKECAASLKAFLRTDLRADTATGVPSTEFAMQERSLSAAWN